MLEEKSRDTTPKHRIMIQQLDGWREIDPSEFLPSEVITEDLVIEDSPVTSDEHEYHLDSSPKLSSISIPPENDKKVQRGERMIYWLPRDVCLVNLFTCHSRD